MINSDEEAIAFDAPRFDINSEADAQEMLKYLDENGYAVVASVATTEQIENARVRFWEHFEALNPLINRHDPRSWITKNWPADVDTGICNRHGFNHSNFLWDARMYPGVKRAFSSIWGTDQLIVSFDAGNVYRSIFIARETFRNEKFCTRTDKFIYVDHGNMIRHG